jgi:hypothetical protein
VQDGVFGLAATVARGQGPGGRAGLALVDEGRQGRGRAARRGEYREAWKVFQEAYAEASYAFRHGELLTPFPRWSLRPPLLDVS